MIGTLNELVTFNVYTLDQDEAGGTEKTLLTTYDEWVKIEQRSGSRRLEQAQIAFTKSFTITKRHYANDPVDPELTEIIYGDAILSIHDVQQLNEGRRVYEELLCYTDGTTVATGS